MCVCAGLACPRLLVLNGREIGLRDDVELCIRYARSLSSLCSLPVSFSRSLFCPSFVLWKTLPGHRARGSFSAPSDKGRWQIDRMTPTTSVWWITPEKLLAYQTAKKFGLAVWISGGNKCARFSSNHAEKRSLPIRSIGSVSIQEGRETG